MTVIEHQTNGDSMNKFSLLVLFSLLIMLVGCSQKTGAPRGLVVDTNMQQVNNTDMKPRIIELKGLKTQPSIKQFSTKFTIDHINIINDNSVEIYVTNDSNEAVGRLTIDTAIELRFIKNGNPVEVRSDKTIMVIDKNTNSIVEGALYPGETAVIYYTMPSSITSCDDYAIFSDYYLTGNFAKLSSFVDCSNLR